MSGLQRNAVVMLMFFSLCVFGQEKKKSANDPAVFESDDTDGSHSVTTVSGDILTRRSYDALYRLTSIETWKLSGSAFDSVLTRCRTYIYIGHESTASFSVDTNYTAMKEIDTSYDAVGRIGEQQVFLLKMVTENDGGSKDFKTGSRLFCPAENTTAYQKIIQTSKALKYDSENRITKRTMTKFLYSDDSLQPVKQAVTTQQYDYNGKGPQPDLKEYEDGKLRKEIQYLNESSYIQLLFFDNDYQIRTTFEHGRKVLDRFIKNGEEIRRKSYD